MWRFASAITVLEILLTVFTATLFSADYEAEAFLTPEDLALVNMPFEELTTKRQTRLEALFGYDSNMILARPRQTAWVSVRVDQVEVDFDARRRREENWATKSAAGAWTILDDPGHDDVGYTVRHRTATSVRSELVRLRGGRMLIVKVSSSELVGVPDEELAGCERRSRILQERMLEKLRWWSAATDGRR